MLASLELVAILLALAAVVAIVALAATRQRARPTRPNRSFTFSADGRAWLELVADDLNELNAHRIDWVSPDVVQVSWRHRSLWVFVVAILAFPIGLLALLFTTTSYGTIVLVQDGSGSTIRLGGTLSNAAMSTINSHVAAELTA